jgi:hypothetical protein
MDDREFRIEIQGQRDRYLSPEERERQRTEQERQAKEQAQQRAQRLEELLRSQGLDPDRLLDVWGGSCDNKGDVLCAICSNLLKICWNSLLTGAIEYCCQCFLFK